MDVPNDAVTKKLLELKDDKRPRRGDKIAKVLPYRPLIEELRNEVPPRSWDEIAEKLNQAGIDISRAALARAFGAGGRRRPGERTPPSNLRSLSSAATGTSGETSVTHGPKNLEM